MTISYNTGATNSVTTATSLTLGIPAGVLVNDAMLLSLEVFTETGTAPTITITGGGGSWTLVPMTSGTNPEVATAGSSIWSYGYAYYRVATAGDPGATLTISESGSAAGTTWISVALAAYTGANTSTPIDVAFGTNAQGVSSLAAPIGNTATDGDWAVYLACAGVAGSGGISGPGTQRESVESGALIAAGINDSNGAVGNSGTSIGGGAWTQTGGAANWWSLFTIGISPVASGQTVNLTLAQEAIAAPAPGVQEQITLTSAGLSLTALAPVPQVQVGLATAQEAVAAYAPAMGMRVALGVAQVNSRAYPVIVSGGNLPPLGGGAGGSVTEPGYGGSVTKPGYGGSVTSSTYGGEVQ